MVVRIDCTNSVPRSRTTIDYRHGGTIIKIYSHSVLLFEMDWIRIGSVPRDASYRIIIESSLSPPGEQRFENLREKNSRFII